MQKLIAAFENNNNKLVFILEKKSGQQLKLTKHTHRTQTH